LRTIVCDSDSYPKISRGELCGEQLGKPGGDKEKRLMEIVPASSGAVGEYLNSRYVTGKR
jgi:hypothetical protein